MIRFWQQIGKGEKGQALPIVLVLLVLGGLLITPTLSYATTSLNAVQITKQNVKGVYAADAGVENVLWCIKNSEEPPEELPENINGMEVAIEIEDIEDVEEYALYYGRFVETGEHYDWLAVDGEMGDDLGGGTYQYTITVTWQPPPPGEPDILLDDIGVRLPVGYVYEPGSAALPEFFDDNLFTRDPDVYGWDGFDAQMLRWELQKPYPEPRPMVTIDNQTATQTFYVTGEGEQEGDYTWAVAGIPSIGTASEFSGILYRITATATLPGDDDEDGEVTAKVMTDVIFNENTEELLILLWQTTKEQDDD